MFVVVAYDVNCTKRRNRVAKILANYGERVNLSVFECEFKKADGLTALKKRIREVIKAKQDHIRYYILCAECREKISVQGRGDIQEPELVRFV